MNGVAARPLRDVIRLRNEVVHPRDNPTGIETFVGLEHIEPQTGRRIGAVPIDLGSMTGRKARFHPGDVVYGYLRPYLNKVWIAEFAGFCSVDQYVFTVDETIADPPYVAAYLRSPAYLAAAPIDETPGQLPRIRIDEVLSTPIPLPPLDEQRRIAARLIGQHAEVDRLRESADERGRCLNALAISAIRAAIGTSAETAQQIKLGSIAEVQLGKMMSPAARRGERGIPYLRNANVQWDRFDLSDVGQMDFSAVEEAKFALRPADVLVCEGGEPGRAAVWAGQIARCGYQKALHRIRPYSARLDPQFLVYRLWMGALDEEFADSHAATTIAHLPAVRLKDLALSLPPVAEQRRIVARLREQLAEIDEAKAALESQRKAIDTLPAALLREVFGPTQSPDG